MNRGRGETGSLVAALGGLLLLVSLFLDWYRLPTFTVTAWTAFEVWDLVLAALAVAVIVSAASDMGWWRGPSHGLGLLLLGVAALVIVVSQLLDPPPTLLHSGTGDGGWLALVGAALMAVGAVMAESRVTLSFNAGAPGGRAPRTGGWRRPPRGVPADVPVAGTRRSPAGVGERPPDAARVPYEDERGYGPPPPPPPPRR
ncbi:MAG: hypothetical protein QOF77_1817 [Solirubrobacteraceae bacterium]|jgi:hypothetical protein|nr:hypothetical protein [Solirubrobacteraceae bacterium]